MHAAQDERTPQSRLPRLELLPGEPVGRDDAAVEPLRGVMVADTSGEGETQDLAAVRGVVPQVDPEQRLRLEPPRGLLARLAHHRREEGLAALDMPSRLIEQQTAVDAFLNHQKATAGLGDRRDRYIRPPAHGADCSDQ